MNPNSPKSEVVHNSVQKLPCDSQGAGYDKITLSPNMTFNTELSVPWLTEENGASKKI
tara:strand:- start:334 stop:507 length:174 start_codon:yes stop_codon:yes gene_type:complete